MMELWGEIMEDDWGKVGIRSKAGIYYWHSKKRNLIDEDTCYSAVIFCGNKPKERSPTTLAGRYEALYLFIKEKPQVLGVKCAEIYNKRLPFQVTIRSLRKSMSLACHPTEEHAERLHRMNPEKYSSDEHKPKLIIAMLPFKMLAGFRNREEIFSFLKAVPELTIVIPYTNIQDYLHSGKVIHLKRMLYFLMSSSYDEMKLSLDIFFKRMSNADEAEKSGVLYDLIKSLHEQYPYDSCVYAPFFFNYFTMPSGSSIFLPPGTVHTYLYGDCIEVTSASENVVRGGLTNLDKDVEEFLLISDYSWCNYEMLTYRPTKVDEYSTVFTPPAKEFGVLRINVPAEKTYTIDEQESCSMLFVIRGSAKLEDSRIIKLGTTLFILPFQRIHFKVRKDITIYVVYPNPDAPEGEFGKLF